MNVADGLLVSGHGVASRPGVRHSSEPRKRFPASGSSDEDPYSLTPSGTFQALYNKIIYSLNEICYKLQQSKDYYRESPVSALSTSADFIIMRFWKPVKIWILCRFSPNFVGFSTQLEQCDFNQCTFVFSLKTTLIGESLYIIIFGLPQNC